jgi:hypothetical protein
LHRYLAKAVWYPTALLPCAGVQWRAIDDRTAQATLNDRENRVSLEFRFKDAAEVVAVYTDGRWRRRGNRYELTPWETHFNAYRRHEGMLVPFRAEVCWYAGRRLEVLRKGEITALEYELERIHGA